MKTALVTGGEGFLASYIIPALVEAGYEVQSFDVKTWHLRREGQSLLWNEDAIDYFRGHSKAFDVVVHLAANVGGRRKIDGDPLSIATNMALDSLAFKWAVKNKPGKFIYMSSSAAYPISLQIEGSEDLRLCELDIDVNDIWMPDNTYGLAKLAGEVLAVKAAAEGLNVFVARPFSGYSETQSLDYPFPSFVGRAKRHDNPFTIWGTGTEVRDWIHAEDITAAIMTAIRDDVTGPYNLCTGRPTTFLELAGLVTMVARYEPEIELIPEAPTGVHTRVGDPTKMLKFFTPTVSLEEGVERAMYPRLAARL